MNSVESPAAPGFVQAGPQTPEFWADVTTRDIISVADDLPEPIRSRCVAFRDQIEALLLRRFRAALKAERKTVLAEKQA